jgi:hypothetical protein
MKMLRLWHLNGFTVLLQFSLADFEHLPSIASRQRDFHRLGQKWGGVKF